MEKSGMNLDNSINYAEGRNATPTAPPAYDDAMASAYEVHNNRSYEQSQPLQAPYGMSSNENPNAPGSGYYPQPQQPPSMVTVQTVGSSVPGVPLPVGPRPIKTTCPSCNKQVTSRVTTKNTCCCKCCLCSLLFLSGVCLLCSCLPFCLCGPERVSHFCPKCNAHLGTWVNV